MAGENFELKPGFFTFSNLKQGEKIIDRYKQIPGCFNSRTSVIDKLLNIPATFWGEIDIHSKDESKMWWRTSIYDKALNMLSPDEMSRTILYGKVLQKAKSGPCYEVVLMNALDEICLIHNKTIRKFLYDDGGGGKKKSKNDKNKSVSNEGSNNKRRFSAVDEESNEDSEENSQKPVKEFEEDELIEEHSGMSSEDDMQEDDCSSDSGSDSEKTESDKDTDEDVDQDFVRIEPRTKEKRIWTVVDALKETN